MAISARFIRAFEGPNLFTDSSACVVSLHRDAEAEAFARAAAERLGDRLVCARDEKRGHLNLIATDCDLKAAVQFFKQALAGFSSERGLLELPSLSGHERPTAASRVPIAAVTGTNGKTTVVRLLSHLLARSGQCVGMATSGGVYIDGKLVFAGDTTGPKSAKRVLAYDEITVAVLETARGGIVKRGLGFEWCDVGIITNVQPDHIGQDGIESVDDILAIKTLIAKRVRPNGTLILNADDERVASLAEWANREGRRVVFFSLASDNPRAGRHDVYFERDGKLCGRRDGGETCFGPTAAVPITQHGTAKFHVANALAAIAAAAALGATPETITGALATFEAVRDNPGRGNLFRVAKGHVMVDYGHNPEAFRGIGEMLRRWPNSLKTAVVGLPGDRSDDVIAMCASTIGEFFDKVIIREDRDTRGRAAGEVPRFIARWMAEYFPRLPLSVADSEADAIARALREMENGEILVVFYDNDAVRVREQILASGGEPCELLPEPQSPERAR